MRNDPFIFSERVSALRGVNFRLTRFDSQHKGEVTAIFCTMSTPKVMPWNTPYTARIFYPATGQKKGTANASNKIFYTSFLSLPCQARAKPAVHPDTPDSARGETASRRRCAAIMSRMTTRSKAASTTQSQSFALFFRLSA